MVVLARRGRFLVSEVPLHVLLIKSQLAQTQCSRADAKRCVMTPWRRKALHDEDVLT